MFLAMILIIGGISVKGLVSYRWLDTQPSPRRGVKKWNWVWGTLVAKMTRTGAALGLAGSGITPRPQTHFLGSCGLHQQLCALTPRPQPAPQDCCSSLPSSDSVGGSTSQKLSCQGQDSFCFDQLDHVCTHKPILVDKGVCSPPWCWSWFLVRISPSELQRLSKKGKPPQQTEKERREAGQEGHTPLLRRQEICGETVLEQE